MKTYYYIFAILATFKFESTFGQHKSTDINVFGSIGKMYFSNSYLSSRQNLTANDNIRDGQFEGDFNPPLSFVRTMGIGINPFKNKSWHINLSYWSGWIQDITVHKYEGEMNNYSFKFEDNIFYQSGSIGFRKDFQTKNIRNRFSCGLALNIFSGQDNSLYSASITPNQGVDRIQDKYDVRYQNTARLFSDIDPFYIHPAAQFEYAYSLKSYFEVYGALDYIFKEIISERPRNNFNGFGMQIGMRTRISLAKEGN